MGRAESDELAVHQRIDQIVEVAHGNRYVAAEPECIEPVDPDVVTSFRAAGIGHRPELRAGKLIERPTLRAVIAGRHRPIEHLALSPVEAAEMAACQRHPKHAVMTDIGPAGAEAGRLLLSFAKRQDLRG